MNKGLELSKLISRFGLPPKKLDIIIHAQSVVHCLVCYATFGLPISRARYEDSNRSRSVLAAAHASTANRLTFAEFVQLTFEMRTFNESRPNWLEFACRLADPPLPSYSANEVAVDAVFWISASGSWYCPDG